MRYITWRSIGTKVSLGIYIRAIDSISDDYDVFCDGEYIIIPQYDNTALSDLASKFTILNLKRRVW